MYTIGVIHTDRSKDVAYVYVTKEDPYWSTNTELSLQKIEGYLRCKFEDGEHPFVEALPVHEWQQFKL